MPVNRLLAVKQLGQQIWLDNLSRTLLLEGALQRLIDDDGVVGVTSNPSIFHKAVAESPYYRDDLEVLRVTALEAEARYESLLIPDVRHACDMLMPVYRGSGGDAGYVSLEVSPHLAADEEGTILAAKRLRTAVGRDNLLIKLPATPQGIAAFERLTAQGVRVNVTLMFSLRHHDAVARAYLRGARRWVQGGGNPEKLKSVASIFLSRVDTLADKHLDALGTSEARSLRGKSAVAMARLAYQQYRKIFHGPEFADLARAGVRPQYPLWASTGTKNPAYSDVLYLEQLIGPETVNTVPDATLAAFRDHGRCSASLTADVDAARRQFDAMARLGIDLDSVGEELQVEGVRAFVDSFDKLLALMV